jgi:formylmethanofuran:tetrahydromethanopterin formyltransferase
LNLFFIIKVEMGLFSKIGGVFKSFIDDPSGFVKSGVFKYGPAIEKVSGALKHVPGGIGLVAAGVESGIKKIQEVVKEVPNPEVQKQLSNELAPSVTYTPKPNRPFAEGSELRSSALSSSAAKQSHEGISSLAPVLAPAIGGIIKSFYKPKKKRKKR